jgi:hypothetical protein
MKRVNRLEARSQHRQGVEGGDRQVADEHQHDRQRSPSEDGDDQQNHPHGAPAGDGLPEDGELRLLQAHAYGTLFGMAERSWSLL